MQEKAEFLIELSSAKVDKLEKALERNWIAHLILAGIGLAFVVDIGDLPKSFAKYFSQDQYNIRLAAVLIRPILLYYFMKFGHLTEFVHRGPERSTTHSCVHTWVRRLMEKSLNVFVKRAAFSRFSTQLMHSVDEAP